MCTSSFLYATGCAIRAFLKNTFVYRQESFKLEKVYERLTSKEKLDSHKAEADVNMLISCAATYGDAFVDWANKNAKPLLEVPLMEIGRKLGS